ncbi:PCYCGC motif-containing (lipo)protein [Peribacillus sp. SCS-26]|uniref:PCYCGC motif-containing (lipo)protein n=1 Tax=Paraperibacillus marinus TaxID=3115295 RepID=UPI003905CBEC
MKEETQSRDVLPEFLNGKAPHIKKIYEEAARHKKLLSYIPCYCGCYESAGHMDTYQCFIAKELPNGRILWDEHAANCGICLDTAHTAIMNFKEGKTIKEVRKIIDERYKKGYKKPTPTPLP